MNKTATDLTPFPSPCTHPAATHIAHAHDRLPQRVLILVVQGDTDEELDLAVQALQAQRIAIDAKITRILQWGGEGDACM
jgi:hypothetical protein